MKTARLALTLGLMALLPTLAWAETAAEAYQRGESLLEQGDFSSAAAAYAEAARADSKNQDYLKRYALVRQVMTLRDRLKTEQSPRRWEYYARALHRFYVGSGLLGEALELDKQIHARLGNASSAVMLAQTQLAMNRNAEAAEVLASLDAEKATPSSRALHGVALVRLGKTDDARRIADALVVPTDAGPGILYSVARLHAAMGNGEGALGLLGRCFEAIPPSQLPAFKRHAQQNPDFAALASTPGFAEVMKTESKVSESKCSGGSKCSGCPMRGKCGSSQGGGEK